MQNISKPILRGHFHQAAFFIALIMCFFLIRKNLGESSLLPVLVYSVSLCTLFGISTLYHRINWNQRARVWMRRLDHSAIFFLIAGTVTPVCYLGLSTEHSSTILWAVWIAAGAGILQSLFWVSAPKWISSILYVTVGWLAAPYLPELNASLGTMNLLFILGGGIVYTLGAVVYAIKKPNPWPRYFGYHEIFHILVVIAAAIQFMAVYRLPA